MSGAGPLSPRPMPSSFDDNEEANKPALRRVTERLVREPLIPIGCALTVAAFTNAWLAMRRGDHARVQRMFRARVLAQGFTVLAMAAGGLYFADERHRQRELWKVERERDAEEKRQKWIRELERRDDEDKAVREVLLKKKARRAAAAGDRSERAAAAVAAAEDTPSLTRADRQQVSGPFVGDDEKEGGSGIFGAISRFFGGGSGGGGSGQEPKLDAPTMDKGQVARTTDLPGTKK